MQTLADIDFGDEDYPPNLPETDTGLTPPGYSLIQPEKLLAPVNPVDPSMLGYPPTLLVELAMRTSPLNELLDAYGIGEIEWETIRNDPTFITDLARTVESLKEDGAGFKMKAKLQAESLLQTSWRMIHDMAVPPAVRADLIKSTVKWGGLEPKAGAEVVTPGSGFSISINFGAGVAPGPRVIEHG